MTILRLSLIFLFFCCATLASANELDDIIEQIVPKSQISNHQLKALREELKLQKIFIEGVKGIEINGGQLVNVNRASATIEELIISSFGAKSASLPAHLRDTLSKTVKESIKRPAIQNTLLTLKKFVYDQASSKKIMMSSVARRFGYDVGLVYLLTLQIDLTFPSIMMAMGHMEFAPLLVTPVSSIATASYTAIKNAVKLRHLVKTMGGFASAREYLNIIQKVKGFFHTSIIPQFDIVDIGVAGKGYTLTIERQNLLSRFKQKLGYNKRLNYKNLVEFLESKNMISPLCEQVLNSQRPEQVKLLRLLHRIELENNTEVVVAMKERFGSFIQEMDGIPDFTEGRKWASRISKAATFEEFGRMMMNIPDDIPPRVFDRIWRHHILPSASESVGPFISKSAYTAFRNLANDWQNGPRKLMADSVDLAMDDHWRGLLADYFYKAMGPVNGCGAIFNKRGNHPPLL